MCLLHKQALVLLFCLLMVIPAAAQDDALTTLKRNAVTTYADIVFATYDDAYQLAVELQMSIDAFLAAPSVQTLEAARDAWLLAREPYGQTEAFRFYGGPIDDADGPEGLINAWPLDEAYIDYVEGDRDSGLINHPQAYPTLDAELLMMLNEAGAEENISVGYHAVEFLLWGQDFNPDGAGDRPYTDYTTAPNADRRGAYLALTAALLTEHLDDLREAWRPEADNYRAAFLALEPDEALARILTGIGVLSKSELAGERMFTAYDNQDQEDEHSCFSDNTHRDIVNNLRGIQNVYLGTYTRLDGSVISGTGVQAVLAAVDAEANDRTLELLQSAGELVDDLYIPFDRAIVLPAERDHVLETVLTLFDLGDQIAENARLLGLHINTALP